jgi:hypothetical protein
MRIAGKLALSSMLGFKLRDAPLDPARDVSQNIRTKSESRSLDQGQSELKSRPKRLPANRPSVGQGQRPSGSS